jgi:hypothetical protein
LAFSSVMVLSSLKYGLCIATVGQLPDLHPAERERKGEKVRFVLWLSCGCLILPPYLVFSSVMVV